MGELRQRWRLAVASRLERGVPAPASVARACSVIAAPFLARGLRRSVEHDGRAIVVTVGGATLGGSGKTRVALACVLECARRGRRVALVGHAYRARPGRPRVVGTDDTLDVVGDEALACARRLEREGASSAAMVVVGTSRAAAVAYASSLVGKDGVLVVDGALQLRPQRASLALLAVDAERPWGSGRALPFGDLRAPPEALLDQVDFVVPVGREARDVWWRGDVAPLAALAGKRLALFTALARPDRIAAALAGLDVVRSFAAPDHGPITPALASAMEAAEGGPDALDAWVMTEKCFEHARALRLERPVAVLRDSPLLRPFLTPALVRSADGVEERGRRPNSARSLTDVLTDLLRTHAASAR